MSEAYPNQPITFTREQAQQTIVSANESGQVFTLQDYVNDLDLRLSGAHRHENYIPAIDEMTDKEARMFVIAVLSAQSPNTITPCPCGRPCTFGDQLDIIENLPDSPHGAKIADHYLRRTQFLMEMAEADLVVIK